MPELNVLTASIVGAFAAAVWSMVSIRCLLRGAKYGLLSVTGHRLVWCAACFAYPVAVWVALIGSVIIGATPMSFLMSFLFTHKLLAVGTLAMNVFMFLGVGLLATALTYLAGLASANALLRAGYTNAA